MRFKIIHTTTNIQFKLSNFKISKTTVNQFFWFGISNFGFKNRLFYYKQPVYKQLALGWQIAKQLSERQSIEEVCL